jgi:hypothetical protein
LALLFGAIQAHSQMSNAGFENLNASGSIQYWGNTFIQAVWIDSNGISHSDSIVIDQNFCQSSNDAHTGSKSMEMRNAFNYTQNKGISGGAWYSTDTLQSPYTTFVPVQTLPTHLNFYYKYFPVGNDTASASIEVYDLNTTLIGSAIIHLSGGITNFTAVNLPISYTASDTAGLVLIHFLSSSRDSNAQFGTRFLVDDVSFTTPNYLNEYTHNTQFICCPNPSNTFISITPCEGVHSISIANSLGEIVFKQKSNFNDIDVHHLANGVYFLHINTAKGKQVEQLIISHP